MPAVRASGIPEFRLRSPEFRGSTTGSLWVSKVAGGNWERLSEHLPPIYAVRFMPARR